MHHNRTINNEAAGLLSLWVTMDIIQLQPYPYYIAVVFDEAQCKELCAQLDIEQFGYWHEKPEDQSVASAHFFRRATTPRALGVLSFYDEKFDIVSAAHEGVHAMSDLMVKTGLKYDPYNDEWYTYMLEFIMYTVREQRQKWLDSKVPKQTIATGHHSVVQHAPVITEAERAERYAKMQALNPVFTIDALNKTTTDFMDDK